MLETYSIPVLMKTIDFLFDEGRKILEERRLRRMYPAEQPTERTATPDETSTVPANRPIRDRKTALSTPVDQALWNDSEKKVTHLLALLKTYKTNYYLAKEQYAKHGSAFVPQIIVHNLADAEDGIANTIKELQTLLTQMYGNQVVIDDDL